ncbi:MAG: DUF4129 domain-containing protein [Chloroflexi bacterium]|nr:DUF4129 domain-containing protein [Chloroflexota bacterium]
MPSQTPFNFKLGTLNFRKELRIALLAAMETCWVFTIVVFLSELTRSAQPLTPLPFFIAYWLALIVGRTLPRSKRAWIFLQISAVVIAFITVIAVARAEIYPNLNWYDVTWLPRFVSGLLSLTHGFAVEHIVSLSVIYVFIRGLGFAQRPLTLWFIGFQFRLGIVIFAGLFLASAFFRGIAKDNEFELWIFIYFFLSLLSIALARIEEMSGDWNYSTRWAVTFLAAIALVLFIGLGVLQIFTLATAQAILMLFAPLGWLLGILIVLAAVPFGYLLDWLVHLIRPFLESFGQIVQGLEETGLGDFIKNMAANRAVPIDATVITILKTIFMVAVVLGVGYWLAQSLNRRMQKIENEQYVRESISDDSDARSRDDPKKKSKARPRKRNLSAETIRRIYATLVAHAANAGVLRQVAETPYELEPRLAQHWNEEKDDIHTITEAYVDVHYAEHTATEARVNQVREAWERIKRKT